MTDPKKDEAKYFTCIGDALVTLKAYRDEIHAMQADHVAIRERYNTEAEQCRARHDTVLAELWKRLNMLIGLDHTKTWQNPEYQVETRYIEEGYGCVIFEKITEDSPFARIMGVSDEDSEPALEVVPDREKMN